jgi:hypothetical protein
MSGRAPSRQPSHYSSRSIVDYVSVTTVTLRAQDCFFDRGFADDVADDDLSNFSIAKGPPGECQDAKISRSVRLIRRHRSYVRLSRGLAKLRGTDTQKDRSLCIRAFVELRHALWRNHLRADAGWGGVIVQQAVGQSSAVVRQAPVWCRVHIQCRSRSWKARTRSGSAPVNE